MKGVIFPVTIIFLMLAHSSQPVYVKDGDLSFPLDAVKKLKELLDEDARAKPHMMARESFIPLCERPELPEEFRLVCKREDVPLIFNRLSLAVQDTDVCEICANAACAGCR